MTVDRKERLKGTHGRNMHRDEAMQEEEEETMKEKQKMTDEQESEEPGEAGR